MMDDFPFDPRRAPAPPPEGLAERLAARLPAEIASVRPLPPLGVRWLSLFLLLAAALVGWGSIKGAQGWQALEPGQQWPLGLVLSLGALWVAGELSLRMTPSPRLFSPGWLAPAAVLAAVLGWCAWVLPWEPEDAYLFYAPCLKFTAAGVALAAVLLWAGVRRGFAWARSPLLWAGGSALAGFGAVELFCPLVEQAHVLTSHFVPALASAAVGWALARVLARR